jgi:hypothetical protein
MILVENFYNRQIVLWLTPKILPISVKLSPASRLADNFSDWDRGHVRDSLYPIPAD